MKKQSNNEFGYRLLKPLFWLYYFFRFNPTIIGKKNIPSKGGLVVCGNHINFNDQFNIMMVTSRVIHYMAKEEYFEGKTAWFYRFVGCIKVDRRIHDENAKSEARDVLNNGGVIGLFPEGTRDEVTCKEDKLNMMYEIVKNDMSKHELVKRIKNKCFRFTQIELLIKLNKEGIINSKELKEYVMNPNDSLLKLVNDKKITVNDYENSLLLPLKFGAVSLAQKTNSLIVPFATTGEYTGRNGKLTTRIGEAFSVKDMDLEVANKLLRKKIIDLMQKSE